MLVVDNKNIWESYWVVVVVKKKKMRVLEHPLTQQVCVLMLCVRVWHILLGIDFYSMIIPPQQPRYALKGYCYSGKICILNPADDIYIYMCHIWLHESIALFSSTLHVYYDKVLIILSFSFSLLQLELSSKTPSSLSLSLSLIRFGCVNHNKIKNQNGKKKRMYTRSTSWRRLNL